MHQLGAAQVDRVTELGQPAFAHRNLVDAELRVAFDVTVCRWGAAGLEVDDVHFAVGVTLDAVDRAAQPGAGVLDFEPRLTRDPLPITAGMPREEAPQRI